LFPLVVGIILAGILVIVEKDKKDPMVPLSLFKSRNFTGSNLMTFAMYGALSGFMFALVIYLQTKMHYSAIKAGLSLLPVTIIMSSVPGDSSGIASGINNAVSRVGGLVVIALLGILGAEHVYKFSMLLSGILAVAAGIISYLTIVSPKTLVASE